MSIDAERERRAALRRSTYDEQVVRLGELRPALYEGKMALERQALQTALVQGVARLVGHAPQAVSRAEWPGEVVDIDERRRGTPDWLERCPEKE